MARQEIGPVAGFTALVAVLGIMIVLIAVLALVVVNALKASPWGVVTIGLTVPIAMAMGLYLRYLRPGRVLEATAIGLVLLVFALYAGRWVAEQPSLAPIFTLSGPTLAILVMVYGFFASVLPVWLLLAPRDYLSAFVKIGVVIALAVGIIIVLPPLQMPALTQFTNGTGPVFAGKVFPFAFITIACGAISGFHALISSGTTPKMIEREGHARFIGYGGMLTESFVAIMALVAASVLDPGIYFAMNAPAAVIGPTVESAAKVISEWGWVITPELISQTAKDVGEHTILHRAGGAPTLAVGIAQIMAQVFGGKATEALWYHFAILFEALFILTAVDAGTRAGRFMIQDLLGHVYEPLGRIESIPANVIATILCVSGWGYFVYQGTIDPLGGVNTIWPLFGIGNQMLAGIALLLATTVLIKMKREKYTWVTLVPTAWLLICTLSAAWQKVASTDPKIGFFALASKYSDAAAAGTLIAPAKTIADMQRVAFNNYLCGSITIMFAGLVIAMAFFTVKMSLQSLRNPTATAAETPYRNAPEGVSYATSH
jgi:carbon starvation protein